MFKKIIKINVFLIFLTTFVFAEIINKVQITGNKRISNETIFVYGNIELNKDYTSIELNSILKNLYSTNFFKDIDISIESSVLYLTVEENPIIESLSINGIKKKELTKLLLEKVSLKERNSFIDSLFLKDINLLTNIIKQFGYYFVKIDTSKVFNKQLNTVKISYNVS
ncbi:hypothetical protein N9402_02010, partial [Candidatus Pelagibacter sp.]|nr:hypothetical protein [Candidatus Pelagibacter sp.]